MLTTQQLLDFYGQMILIRAFEEKLSQLFSKGLLGGTSHFCIGQEASAVGILNAARKTDWIVSNHRGHGHLLARGLDPARVMAELLGKLTGYCGGKGGSQHMCSIKDHFLGTNGIVGGGIPLATGAAFALKYRKQDDIAIVFFGDGAANQGTFHETLNIASLWQLPVLYVCENNGYGMSTPTPRALAGNSVAKRAQAYGIKAITIDGRNLEEVYDNASNMTEEIRTSKKPQLLELITYRLCGHSKSEPRVYRTREEEENMRQKDTIQTFPELLKRRGCTEEQVRLVEENARKRIEIAAEQALAAPAGGIREAREGVFEP